MSLPLAYRYIQRMTNDGNSLHDPEGVKVALSALSDDARESALRCVPVATLLGLPVLPQFEQHVLPLISVLLAIG